MGTEIGTQDPGPHDDGKEKQACMTVLSTLTATIYFPLIPMLASQLSVSVQAINLTVTVYVIFQAVSPAIFASLSDSFGRRPVLLGIILIYASATLGLVVNHQSYAVLVVLRGLQSIGGSATSPLAYGIISDVTATSQRGKMLGAMLSICNGISAVGPVIGGAVALGTSGVTWVFASLLVIAASCFVVAGCVMPETARRIVGNGSKPPAGIHRTWWDLVRSNAPFRHQKPDVETSRPLGRFSPEENRKRWTISTALGAFRIIAMRDAAAILWMIATSYSVYYTFQVAIPVIFSELYHYNELQIGLALLPGLVGMTVGGFIAGKLLDSNYAHVAKANGIDVSHKKAHDLFHFPVEAARYRNCFPFLFLQLFQVIGYGWGVTYHVHPAVLIILHFLICGVSTLLSHTASALLVDIFPDQSSTAYAASQAVRCGLCAVSAAVLQPLINAFGRGWYFTTFALFVSLGGLLSVEISQRWGMKWRQARCTPPVEDSSNSGPIP
ncbi:major facilitator superfamily domain-containing protein [Xylaria palmicola]|nr:major facilitator superfamily domain-containing protein [Xylaria palmicola]